MKAYGWRGRFCCCHLCWWRKTPIKFRRAWKKRARRSCKKSIVKEFKELK